MSVVRFQCPACDAPLRLQNRALFVGRALDCPDCHEPLLIEADGSDGVKAKPLPRSPKPVRSAGEGASASENDNHSLPHRARLKAASNVSDLGISLQAPPSAWDRLCRRPAALGWFAAAVLAVILLIVVKPWGDQRRSESAEPAAKDVHPVDDASNKLPLAQKGEQNSQAAADAEPKHPETDRAEAVAKIEIPPLPESPAVVDPARDDKPVPLVEKPAVEEPKPPMPTGPVVLSPEAVEAKLRQKISRFDQSKPAPFVKVLDTIEELAGIPIVWDLDRVDDVQLQKPVTLQLKQTTVGEILDTLLKQVGLERRTVEGKIELNSRVEAVPRP